MSSPSRANFPVDKGGRIPSLDGLRAVSIALVVGFHTMNRSARLQTHQDYHGPWQYILNGGLGVSVFFVISGFLITWLLLRELEKTQTINLRDFYLRRTFRIWPAFYAFLAAILLLHHLHLIGLTPTDVIAAAAFVFNYVPKANSPWLGHIWSLSVEEQFYLFWPGVLLLLGRRRSIAAAVAIIVLAPVARFLQADMLPASSIFVTRLWQMTHTRLDTLMFGCLIALLYDHQIFQRFVAACFRFRLHWIALIWLFAGWPLLEATTSLSVRMALVYSLEAIAIALLVVWAVQNPATGLARPLNSRLMIHLGVISYSLYLWNVIFCTPLNHTWTAIFPVSVLFSLAAAEISYFAVERPFLKLRAKFSHAGRRYQHPTDVLTAHTGSNPHSAPPPPSSPSHIPA